MRLGVIGRFSPQRDATLGAIVDVASARGHDVVILDIARLISGPAAFSPQTGQLMLGEVALDLGSLDALWLGPLPSASARLAPDDAVMSARDFDGLLKRQAARHALGWSIALGAEARGVPVLSSPSRARPFDHKPFQLAALHAAGVPVPSTRVADAHHGIDDDGVMKPVIGGPVVRAADAVVVPGGPAIWQPRLRGRHLRLAVVDGVVIGAAALDLEDGVLDSRLSHRGAVPLAIDATLQALGARCARTCHFDVCAIDVVDTADGPVVLDVNRTPQLLDLDAPDRLLRACLDLIEARAR